MRTSFNSTCIISLSLIIMSACSMPEQPAEAVQVEASADPDTAQARLEIHHVMNAWHHAAAVADEETYFGTLSEDAIFLGTDKTERWEKDYFATWGQKFFERDSAWVFHPHHRVIYFSEEGSTAWFEELLDTWMGPCRGSGVLSRKGESWELRHYNLAMLIDNEDVDQVLEIIEARD